MITILVGKSGSGKDTLLNELVKRETFLPVVSTTSRPMRDGEKEGRGYNFVSKEEFLKRAEDGVFLEYRAYNTLVDGVPDTWYYGSPKLSKEAVQNSEYAVVLDMQGARDYVSAYGKENCFVAMIEVPDNVRKQRAMARGSFDETEWNRRLADDEVKFSKEAASGIVDCYLQNTFSVAYLADRLDDALASFKKRNSNYDSHVDFSNPEELAAFLDEMDLCN